MTLFTQHIARHTSERPDAAAVSDDSVTLSWSALTSAADGVAAGLTAAGVKEGDRVAVLEFNTIAFAEIFVACTKIGAVFVPLNWRLVPSEIAKLLDSADPILLLVGTRSAEHGRALAEIRPTTAIDIGSDTYASWRALPAAPTGFEPAEDTTVCITYTSGSTGSPKGVVMAHSAFSTVLPDIVRDEGIESDSITLQALPLFHIGGLAWLVSAFIAGAQSVMLPIAAPAAILAAIARDRITHLCLVSTLLQMLLDEQRRNPVDISSVQMIQCGASPMPEAYLREAARAFEAQIVTLYGLSEAGGLVCNQIITPQEIEAGLGDRLLASGWRVPGIDVEIRTTEAPFTALPDGEIGEIVTRSPGAMAGYWRQPELTRETMSEDGWLRTGDLGYFDETGLLYVKGRLKDLIISGGENIFPAEIENVIAEIPGVAQVAVVGARHPKWGESPVAVVTLESGAEVSSQIIDDWCREHLSSFKRPHGIRIVEQLPLVGGGKADKVKLREVVANEFA